MYYLYGTRSETTWIKADRFDCYYSKDLENWERPFEIFHRSAITKHLKNIFESGELEENSVCSILERTATDGKDYFDEQLERIRDIRSSERRFYQKITDIYSQCSADYDLNAPETKDFFATVQNKLHYETTQHTAADGSRWRLKKKDIKNDIVIYRGEDNLHYIFYKEML